MSTNKKDKKDKKKKLSSLILLLFLTVIMLSTATYAWFTSNRTVNINDIEVQVSTGSGLTISSDANDWKTLISNSDIITGYNYGTLYSNNQLPTSVETNPVSTIGAINANGQLDMYLGTLTANAADNGDFYLTTQSLSDPSGVVSSTSGNYVVFDAFLKLDQDADNIYIGIGSGVETSGTDTGIKYASRIAIIEEGTGEANQTPATYAAYKTSASTSMPDSDTITYLEPNSDGHTQAGVDNANLYYTNYTYSGFGTTDPTKIVSGETAGSYVTTDGVKAATNTSTNDAIKTVGLNNKTANATNNEDYFATVTPNEDRFKLSSEFSSSTSGSNLLWKQNYTAGVHKLRIYMWVDGQDVDCENKASGGKITYSLSFTLDPTAGA